MASEASSPARRSVVESTETEAERTALGTLIPLVGDLLRPLERYLTLLGDDAGRAANLRRSSHYDLFDGALSTLVEGWRTAEPLVHARVVREAFGSPRLQEVLAGVQGLSDAAADAAQWDAAVRAMHAEAEALDSAVRRAAGAPDRTSTLSRFRLPGYDLHEQIGAGGFGEVWRVTEQSPNQLVRAVKFMEPHPFNDSAKADERALREANALPGLRHPNIVQYVSAGWTTGAKRRLFIVMEYIEGAPLRDARQNMTARSKVEAMASVLDALAFAHRNSVIHRDVKPSNIMIRASGEAVLIDFGLVAFENAASDLTTTALGTTGYMPPEVIIAPTASRSPRADVYSTGVTLYQILGGQLPNVQSYDPLGERFEELRTLDPVIQKALAAEDERFQSAAEFAEALRRWLDGQEPLPRQIDLASIQTDAFREKLTEAYEAGDEGNTLLALLLVTAVYEAMRICWARAARRASGLRRRIDPAHMPERGSRVALAFFSKIPGYSREPSLANDKYGPASLSTMGFTPTEHARIQELVEAANDALVRRDEWPLDHVGVDEDDLVEAFATLVDRLLHLERMDPDVFAPTDDTV